MFSALALTIWLLGNKICFTQHICDYVKTYVLQIINWITLWTGKIEATEEPSEALQKWLPEDTSHIPLHELENEQVLVEFANTEDSL